MSANRGEKQTATKRPFLLRIECLQNGNGMQVNRGWNASKLEMKCKQTRNEIQANQKPWEWTPLMSISGKLLIRKRAIIEIINDELKNLAQVE